MAGNVTRTASRLADGRELLYFDDEPGTDRSQPDRRDIAAARTASEIRYDVLVDQWVVIAGHRQTRSHLPPTIQCPLCPSTPDRLTEIPPSTTTWWCSRTAFRRCRMAWSRGRVACSRTRQVTGCSCGGQESAAARWYVFHRRPRHVVHAPVTAPRRHRARGAAPGGVAPNRAVRQQPGRGRPWPAEGAAATNAGLKQDASARVIMAGHGFVQNLRRGHYELAAEEPMDRRVAVAFAELTGAI